MLQKENAVVRFGGVPVNVSSGSKSRNSYYNKNIYTDNEPIEGKRLITTNSIDLS